MKVLANRRILLAWAWAAVLSAPSAQAQIDDLFRSPGDPPRSTRATPEPERQAPPTTGKTSQPAPPVVAATPPAQQQQKLVIYTTPTCPHCIRALRHMQARKIDYIQKDVQHDRANQAELRRLGGRGVPHILMGRTTVVGFDPADFDRKYAAWKAQ